MNKQEYCYNQSKNERLKAERGINFDDIIDLIARGKVVAVIAHPNQEKYPEQKIYVIENEGYAYNVPFVKNEGVIFLKTIFASRKSTKQFLSPKTK